MTRDTEFGLKVGEKVDKKFFKISIKDPKHFSKIRKKVNQILNNPYHFKPLKGSLKGVRRVHIGHFVLTYRITGKFIEQDRYILVLLIRVRDV